MRGNKEPEEQSTLPSASQTPPLIGEADDRTVGDGLDRSEEPTTRRASHPLIKKPELKGAPL